MTEGKVKMKQLWHAPPEQQETTVMAEFSAFMAEKHARPELCEYAHLHQFSVTEQAQFWRDFVAFSGIIGEGFEESGLEIADPVHQSRYFPKARLNLAENLMRYDDYCEALVFHAEDQCVKALSWREIHEGVSRLQQALQAAGLQVGDRVAAVIPNCPEAVIAMLAVQSLGGVWSSCSPDFGVTGILERFSQIAPKFLLCTDGYWYKGKIFSVTEKISQVAQSLPSLEQVIIESYIDAPAIPNTIFWDDFIAPYTAKECFFTPLPFDHPAFILFSSGTTGKPKCFIHGVGAYLLTNRLDLMLHNDIQEGDRVLFFTTTGWMMWNWLVGALGAGGTVLLYDGSPFACGSKTLFQLAEDEHLSLLGVSPKFLSVVEKDGYIPKDHHDFVALRRIVTTGSPLSAGNFDFVYQNIKADIHLCPISGGTDILGCFLGGDPRAAVHRGEMQVPLLGKDVQVMDDQGTVLQIGTGELVCHAPFLGMPLGFWDDADHQKYHAAYFERFAANVWCHGDFLERTETGYIIHGRSDTVLNPGGVRIGTAEIYQAIEHLPEITDAVVIGQNWDHDVRIVLFVVLTEGHTLSEEIQHTIRTSIKTACSPRHVPAKILQVAAVPRTRSGKISEKAVYDIVHGRVVRNQEALENPEALEDFAHRAE